MFKRHHAISQLFERPVHPCTRRKPMISRAKKNMPNISGTGIADNAFQLLKEEVDDNSVRHLVVRYRLQNGGTEEARINRGLLFEPHKAKVFFANRGAALPDDCRELFRDLQQALPKTTGRVTSQAGWHQNDFVTRFGTLTGKARSPEHVFSPGDPAASKRLKAGTWSAYVAGIAPLIAASDFVMLGILLGLAAPLASRIGRGGGFSVALCGESSTGKTLTIQVAHSLLTKASEENDLAGFGDTMGSTLNLLPAAGGTCLGFADIKADTNMKDAMQKLRTVVFSGASGQSRKRSTEAPRPDPQFLITFVSAEHPLKELFEEASMTFEGGDAVRTLTIPIPKGDDGGIFAKQIFTPSSDLVTQLEQLLSTQYGTVLPRWIEQLVHIDKEKLAGVVAKQEREFLLRVGLTGSQTPHQRIAKRFALMAAVGYVAIKARLLPCSVEDVFDGMSALYWETIFFLADKPQKALWHQLFQMVEDETVLPLVRVGMPAVIPSKLGFRREEKGEETLFVRREELVELLPVKFVNSILLPALSGSGCLSRSEGELTRIVSQAGYRRGRYYVINAKLLSKLMPRVLGA
ncbi:DUF927 domain-containing protein [Mesorhizobium sp. M1365]|uniref:DUF927 domain-containing protein n=1 Tax=Mesorhizobium sp. M1365 TaxID=2957090 RepID=UPI0033387850